MASDVATRGPRRLLAAAAGAAALAAALAAAPPAPAATLHGSIQGRQIELRTETGAHATTVAPGTYTFVVTDNERIHNFHVLGTPVVTPIDESVGVFTFTDVALAEGEYVFRCDLHPEVFGTFGVNRPPPPTTAPAGIVRVRATRTRAGRFVGLVLAVERSANATAHLRRAGRKVAGVRRIVDPGRRTLRLAVPKRARGGVHYLRVTLREGGRTFVFVRPVRVPR